MDEQIFKGLLSSGDERIDHEHEELFMLLEMLDTTESALEENFIDALKKILQHLIQHFQYEEDLMEQYQYVPFSEHHQQHELILAQLNKIVLDEYEPGYSEYTVKQLVKKWGFNHFLHSDNAFIRFMRGSKQTPLGEVPPQGLSEA